MTLQIGPRTIFLAKPANLSFGEGMSRMRMWFDTRNIEPSSLKVTADGPIGFEIGFQSKHEADAFEEFHWLSN